MSAASLFLHLKLTTLLLLTLNQTRGSPGLTSHTAIYLPELLQLVDLLCSDLPSPELLLL